MGFTSAPFSLVRGRFCGTAANVSVRQVVSFAPTTQRPARPDVRRHFHVRVVAARGGAGLMKDLHELMTVRSALKSSFLAVSLAGIVPFVTPVAAQTPPAIAAHGDAVVATFHAEGAQIYECKIDPANKLVWQVREPAAALMLNGKTVGVHYAGPNWQHVDGSAVKAKMVAAAPGATFNDVPWLKFEAIERREMGSCHK